MYNKNDHNICLTYCFKKKKHFYTCLTTHITNGKTEWRDLKKRKWNIDCKGIVKIELQWLNHRNNCHIFCTITSHKNNLCFLDLKFWTALQPPSSGFLCYDKICKQFKITKILRFSNEPPEIFLLKKNVLVGISRKDSEKYNVYK